MNIAAYCRVSTDKQDQLNSLETQKKFFEEFAENHHHHLVGIYADEGISGTKMRNRDAFRRLMEDAEKHAFEMVVVKDISRMARNTVDLLTSTRTLKSLQIETLFLTSNQTVLGNSEFVLTVFGALAQEESANTSKRVKFGKRVNAEKGRVPNYVYGYEKVPQDFFTLLINEHEADIVRKIYDLYIREGLGAYKIAEHLNRLGETTKRGARWSQNAVARILSNPIYTGKIINGKQEVQDFLTGSRRSRSADDWIVLERPELCIISEETFQQAQAVLASRKKYAVQGGRQSSRHLFSTLIRCQECGYSFRRLKRQYRNVYIRWVCSGRNANGTASCPNHSKLEESYLLEQVRESIKPYLDGDFAAALHKSLQKSAQKDTARNGRQELEKSRNLLAKKREQAIQLFEHDIITMEELKKRSARLKEEEIRIDTALQHLCGSGEPERRLTRFSPEELLSMFCAENLNNRLLKMLVERVESASDGRMEIYFRKAVSSG